MADRVLLVTSPLLARGGRTRGTEAAPRARVRPGRSTASRALAATASGACGRSRPRPDPGGRRRSGRATAAGRRLATARPARCAGERIGRRALAEARRWIGTHEDPPGSNRTPVRESGSGSTACPGATSSSATASRSARGYTIAEGFHGAGCTARGCATSRPPRPGSARPECGSAAVAASPATSRSTTGTAALPTTSGSSSARAGGAFAAIEGNTRSGARPTAAR